MIKWTSNRSVTWGSIKQVDSNGDISDSCLGGGRLESQPEPAIQLAFLCALQRCEVTKWIELDKNQVKCQAVALAGLNVSVLLLVCHFTRKPVFELGKTVLFLFINTIEV